jgi:transposase-like protein
MDRQQYDREFKAQAIRMGEQEGVAIAKSHVR